MSWFDTAGLASFAKSALKEAQKQIDKALDIQEDEHGPQGGPAMSTASKTEPSTPSYGARPPASIPTSNSSVWGSFSGSYFNADPATHPTVTTPPSVTGAKDSKDVSRTGNDYSSDSVDLVTSPESIADSPLLQSTCTILNSDSIEVLGAVAEPRSETSSFMVVASSASSTPASEFSDAGDGGAADGNDNDESIDTKDQANVEYDEDVEDEEEENTVSESLAVTVMEPRGGGLSNDPDTIVTIPPSRQSLHLSLTTVNLSKSGIATSQTETNMDGSTGSEVTLINPSAETSTTSLTGHSNNNKSNAVLSLENFELQTEFSDSTQSFEEVPRSGPEVQPPTNGSSGDEMETTTSSDIEIISNPNGGDGSSTASRLSPSKEGNRGDGNGGGGVGGGGGVLRSHRGHSRELSADSSQCSDELSETDRLHRRISELSEQLEKREFKLLEVTKQNSELQQELLIRQGNISLTNISSPSSSAATSTATTSNHQSSVDAVTEEFTQRLSALEKKFQHAIRERDQLREQLKSVGARVPKEVHETALSEKDFLIGELKQEGEKLSKQILQHSTIIKKLRAKEKDTDEAVKRQKDELREQGEEMERLKKSLAAKEDVERSQIEAVNRLASTKIILESETGELKGKLDDVQQKLDALQVSFNATKQELIDQKRLTEELKSKSANLEVQCADQRDVRVKGDQMQKEVKELREKLRQLEGASQLREQTLRKENADLMRRLEESEMRNEELNLQVAGATVPLLKQMEGLQATLNSRTVNWEKQERDLVGALTKAEERLKVLADIETSSQATEAVLHAEIQGLEGRIAGLMLKVEQTAAGTQQKEIEMQLRLADVERELGRVREERRDVIVKVEELEERLKEKSEAIEELENELRTSRKAVMETSQRYEREEFGADLECMHQSGGGQQRSSPPLSREHSLDGSLTSNQWPLDDIDTISNHGRPSLGSFYGTVGGGGGGGLVGFGGILGGHTSTLENLQSNLKQRDGEVYHLQWEMNRMQTQRNTLANEISEMTGQMEELSAKCAKYDQVMENFQELQQKYDAMLQLYGEKVEEAEELKLDLLESKEAYKTQIEGLLAGKKEGKEEESH